MGYMHINNLYKEQDILMFKECYALEKIHGTSAHVMWSNHDDEEKLIIFSGGEKYDRFSALFDQDFLREKFKETGLLEVSIYGEAYGGSQQGMAHTYGKELKFVAFDVLINDSWLNVPQAEAFVKNFNIEFVHYWKVKCEPQYLNEVRDAFSPQAVRNGVTEPKHMEGVVLRPLIELKKNNGQRLMAKHKRDDFRETKEPRTLDPEKLKVLTEANAVAEEWVTEMRLAHVIDALIRLWGGDKPVGIENTREVIIQMIDDVQRESAGEVKWSKEVEKAIGSKTAQMFKKRLQSIIS